MMSEFEKTDLLGSRKICVRYTPIQQDGLLFHCHSHPQLSVCMHGSGTYMYEGKTFRVSAGDIMVLNKLEYHKCIPDDRDTNFIFVEFSEDFVAPEGSSEFQYSYLQPFEYDFLQENINPYISHQEQGAVLVRYLIEELRDVYDKRNTGYELEMDALMKLILARIRSYFIEKYPEFLLVKNVKEIGLHRAMRYIAEHYRENIRAEDVAGQMNLSSSRFRHIFKEKVHISFKAYIIRMRLADAQRLLLNSDLSVEEVAEQSGFNNKTYFYKIFREYTKVTPHEYRKAKQM